MKTNKHSKQTQPKALLKATTLQQNTLPTPAWGGAVLPMMAYTGRLRQKGASFSGFRYMKGWGFHLLKHMKLRVGKSDISVGKGSKGLTDAFYGCEKVQKTLKTVSAFTAVKGPGGTPHMKAVGMLIVSLRSINFGFRSHLRCSGQNAIIFSREDLV